MIWKALSLSQPYASAIAIGPKRIENRSTPIARNVAPCWVGLHAAKSWYPLDDADLLELWPERPWSTVPGAGMQHYPRGVMLGAMFIDWVEEYPPDPYDLLLPDRRAAELLSDDWAFGPWCLHVAEVRLLPEPMPCRGMLGLWPVTDQAISAALDEIVPEARTP